MNRDRCTRWLELLGRYLTASWLVGPSSFGALLARRAARSRSAS